MDSTRRDFLQLSLGGFGLANLGELGLELGELSKFPKYDLDTESAFAISHPSDIVDTFLDIGAATPYILGRSGWVNVPSDEKITTIRRLHADKLDFHTNLGGSGHPPTAIAGGPTSLLGQFGGDIGLPTAGQQALNININAFDLWYDRLPTEARWVAADGTEIEQATDFAARRFHGDLKINTLQSAVPTLFFDTYRDHLADAAITFMAHGYVHVYLDTAMDPTWSGMDFSSWAKTAFADHLASLPDDRLESLGIDDPGKFDIVDYLESEGLGPGQVDSPFSDPVAREYKRFQLNAHREYLAAYRDRIHDAFPERSEADGISVVANVNIDKGDATPIIIAEVFDAVTGESTRTVPGEKVLDRSYKLADAAGRFERPLTAVGSMFASGPFQTDFADQFDPSEDYPTLLNIQVAEGFANGGTRTMTLAGWSLEEDIAVDNWIRPDGTVPTDLQDFIDFCWANEGYLRDTEPDHAVAVVYSLATSVWQRSPDWDLRDPAHPRAYEGLCALCREHQLPYDVLIFGLPGVWDDQDQLTKLVEYDTVVLPGITAISDAQFAAVEDALDAGVRVVATGGAADRDPDLKGRTDLAELLEGHNAATVVGSSPGVAVADGDPPSTDLREPLTSAGRQVGLGPDGIVPTVRRQSGSDRVFVHLVNYDYDIETDSVPVREEFQLSVSLPGDDLQAARWVTPSGTRRLELNKGDGQYTLTIPRLEVYGILALGPDSAALELGDAAAAEEVIDSAKSTIEQAHAEDRSHVALTRAEAELENAEVAYEHQGYANAEAAADVAITEASAAIQTPTIGIDQSHGQAGGEYGWSSFSNLFRRFNRYEFTEVLDWTVETLDGLELLIIPPPSGGSFDWTEDELGRLQGYLEAGGRVIMLGQPNMPEDAADLSERFGFRFDGDMIIQTDPPYGRSAEENPAASVFDARAAPSTLTQYVVGFRTSDATPLQVNEDSAAKKLAFVHEDSGAYVNRSGPVDDRAPEDESVAGEPILVAAPVEEGILIGTGTSEQFLEPTQEEDGARAGHQDDPLVASLLRAAEIADVTLDSRAGEDDAATESSVGEASSTRSTINQQTTNQGSTDSGDGVQSSMAPTEAEQPGFGLGVGIGSIVGFAALMKWLHDED